MRRPISVLTVFSLTAALFVTPSLADTKADCATAAERSEALREQKHLRDAREALLQCSRDSCPKVVRKDCVKWLAEVEGSQPSLVLRAKDDAGQDLVDVTVSDGGKEITKRLDGGALVVDPGPHELSFVATGLDAHVEKLVVSEGEKNRVVVVVLSKPKSATSAPPPPTATVTSAPPPPPPASGSSPWPWVAGGVGIVGLGVFGAMQIVARGERSDLEKGCGVTQTCSSSQLSPVRTKFVVSGIGLGVGVVGIAASVVLFATSPRSSVALTPTSGGAIMGYGATF